MQGEGKKLLACAGRGVGVAGEEGAAQQALCTESSCSQRALCTGAVSAASHVKKGARPIFETRIPLISGFFCDWPKGGVPMLDA